MKPFIYAAAILLFYSTHSVYAAERLKFQCQWVAPSCQNLFSGGPDGNAGGISFSGLLSPDVQVSATASLQRNADQVTSTMTVQLFDATTQEPSPVQTFVIHEHETVWGGVENFAASNGKLYTLFCAGSELNDGVIDVGVPACQ